MILKKLKASIQFLTIIRLGKSDERIEREDIADERVDLVQANKEIADKRLGDLFNE